jgi:outer membrane protein assembly factor BamB
MTTPNDNFSVRKPLRVWPGLVIVAIVLFLRFVLPPIWPEGLFIGVMAGLAGAPLILIWWLFFSRAPWKERIGAVLLMVVTVLITYRFVHVSIAKGAMGMLFYVLSIPMMCAAFVLWAAVTRNLSNRIRYATMVATIVISCGFWTLIRTGGFSGEFHSDFAWRWSQSHEEKLLAESKNELVTPVAPVKKTEVSTPVETQIQTQTQSQSAPAVTESPVVQLRIDWPGFRGPNRNGIIHGVNLQTDWSASPPVEIWRREIGPGWSSFAVAEDLVYTQEQRGDDEVVACYKMSNGKPVWRHRDSTRFWESNAGPGPRGTPTLSNGCLYSFGATGILNALNAIDGKVIWSRNAATDTGIKLPGWGFAASPLVLDDMVITAVAGQLAAYDIATGKPRWKGPKGRTDYSSPQLVTIDGVQQILLLSSSGVVSVSPDTGKVLWQQEMPLNARIVQPAMTEDGDLLINEGESHGLRRLAVSKKNGKWTVTERWTSNGLKPYFSDFVIHNGYAYGFDGAYLSCIDLKDGQKKWKGGHYGAGQMLLLSDQSVLLILSEKGDLALVDANPEAFKELAQTPAIEGKTWNHPALVRNVLLVRNGEEMAAFRLPTEGH